MKKRCSEGQMIGFLGEAESGIKVRVQSEAAGRGNTPNV